MSPSSDLRNDDELLALQWLEHVEVTAIEREDGASVEALGEQDQGRIRGADLLTAVPLHDLPAGCDVRGRQGWQLVRTRCQLRQDGQLSGDTDSGGQEVVQLGNDKR